MDNQDKWYKKSITAIAFLVLFFPVGLFLMWKYTNWNKYVKWGVSGFFAVMILIGVVSGDTDTGTNLASENETQVENTQNEAQATNEVIENTPVPTQALTEEQKIEQSIRDIFPEKNNRDVAYIDVLEISEGENGLYVINVRINASDNLTDNLVKTGIESDMSQIYRAIYTNYDNVEQASVIALLPLVDKYGNENDANVYITTLEKSEADNINWNANEASLKLSIIPSVWTEDFLHPIFR